MNGSHSALAGYYRLHAGVYDATRWSFLFGREKILELAQASVSPKRILEVGCGTGRNLESLARRFPSAELTGVDLSDSMLGKAKQKLTKYGDRIKLVHQAYDKPLSADGQKFDLVLCSYALTMFNPGWEAAIESAGQDLAPGGVMAVVDFHFSRWSGFRRWMQVNHVRMEQHLRPKLAGTFTPVVDQVCAAYGFVWQYLLFIGRKKGA